MAPSLAAQAIDSLAKDVLAAPLRELGFRKKARHWSLDQGGVQRGVTVQASRFNVGADVRFTVEVGASYGSLGHPHPVSGAWGTAFSCRLSGLRLLPIDDWFEVDPEDEASMDAVRLSLSYSWAELGMPFLLAAASPESVCDYVTMEGSVELALNALRTVARPLGDRDRRIALAQRAAQQATLRDRWRFLPDDPHPLELGLGAWASIARELDEFGLDLEDAERDAALAVLLDATTGMLTTRFHSEQDEADAAALRAHLRP